MKSLRLGLALITFGSFAALAACGDDHDDDTHGGAGHGHQGGGEHGGDGHAGGSDGHGPGSAECAVLGELCHAADTGAGPAADCHELGHVGDPVACSEEFASCIGVCVEEGSTQDPHCAALGELCHVVDTGSGMAHDCHEIGHVNDAAECAAAFEGCAAHCLAERDKLEGAGGAGAGGAPGAGAGGVDAGAPGAGGASAGAGGAQ